mmetsp:Transcript_24092/g.59770  ORF Transcript_24092/g.59770 Transcript_24092/m.59770 type:complete len:202 (-) Transcript_24092:151-756(-)
MREVRLRNSYVVTMVVPHIATDVMRGRTPRRKPRAPCSRYKSAAVDAKVWRRPPGAPDSTCRRVLTISSGVVMNPDVAPAVMPATICTAVTVQSDGSILCRLPLEPAETLSRDSPPPPTPIVLPSRTSPLSTLIGCDALSWRLLSNGSVRSLVLIPTPLLSPPLLSSANLIFPPDSLASLSVLLSASPPKHGGTTLLQITR